MVWRMGKCLNSSWWVGVFDAFWSASWWGIRPSKLPTYPGIWPNFSKKSNAWRLAWGKHGLFWSRSVQNTDYRQVQTIVFTIQSERDNNSPIDCFLTMKTMVFSQSAVCILYCPVLEWTGTLVRKCVHKQSYINITGMVVSTKFLQTQESLPLIYLALQRLGQQTSCKLNDLWACFPPLKTHISVHVNEPKDDG